MANIDHDDARSRLAARYVEMTETELTELAQDQSTLTDDALSVLGSEFSRRGLPFERTNLVDTGNVIDTKLVMIRRFRDVPEAVAAQNVLESEGVACFLADQNSIWMNWMWSNALGGVKLWVREEDVREATELLDQDFSEAADKEQSAE